MSKSLTKSAKSTYRLTTEQARANQAKAVQSRITRSSLAKAHASGASQAVDYVEFTITFTARTQMMLFRLCFMFDHAKKANDLDSLTRSMERLFGVWAHLTQTPAPGQLRPEKMKKLLREYGMKSAIANAMSQAPDPTPNATSNPSPENTLPSESAIRNEPDKENDVSCLTHAEPNPLTNPPLPDAASFQNQTEDSLNSQAGPVPTPDTPTPANGMATE